MTDPVLEQIKTALRQTYGDRLERIVLYGSRARGDAHDDSDYDIAIFVQDLQRSWEELKKLGGIELDLFYATNAIVHVMPYAAGFWRDPKSPLMYELRRDGRDL